MSLTRQDLFDVLSTTNTPDQLIKEFQLFSVLKFQIPKVSALENLRSLGVEELEAEMKMEIGFLMEKLLNELCLMWFGGIVTHCLEGGQIWKGSIWASKNDKGED